MSRFKSVLESSLVSGLQEFYQKSWPSLSDLTIKCSDGKNVPASKLILAIHSEYFSAYFRQQPDSSIIELLEFDSKLIKTIVKSFLDFDEKDLHDVGLDEVIRAADYFQMKDLVIITSEIIADDLSLENLSDILQMTQTLHSPTLKKACFQFIKSNILQV